MTFTKIPRSTSIPGSQENAPGRPRFNSQVTSDRLRESSRLPSFSMVSKIREGRQSMFKEVGLLEEERENQEQGMASNREISEESDSGERVGTSSETTSPIEKKTSKASGKEEESPKGKSRWFSKLAPMRRPRIKTASSAPPPTVAGVHRLSMIALLIAIVLPTISYNNGRKKVEISGADAGLIRPTPSGAVTIESRENSPTEVCTRWAGQSKDPYYQSCHFRERD